MNEIARSQTSYATTMPGDAGAAVAHVRRICLRRAGHCYKREKSS
ncbi:hypothetical protein PAMC26577_26325 [Caballeronia sordidicola]|uniref:Uncharacterized protein n=1 Tax=Caballeronia sordidicola TaxID=196367 RepID=A0A242MGZ1_CABSO|nr:hypothetical protein PAMC26577_26325 [Caballeronia sordidicola]